MPGATHVVLARVVGERGEGAPEHGAERLHVRLVLLHDVSADLRKGTESVTSLFKTIQNYTETTRENRAVRAFLRVYSFKT